MELVLEPARERRLEDLLPRLGGAQVSGATRGRAEERPRLAAGRELADGLREGRRGQHDRVGHVEPVPHEPGQARRLAADDARIVPAAALRERLERDEPAVVDRVGAMAGGMRAMVAPRGPSVDRLVRAPDQLDLRLVLERQRLADVLVDGDERRAERGRLVAEVVPRRVLRRSGSLAAATPVTWPISMNVLELGGSMANSTSSAAGCSSTCSGSCSAHETHETRKQEDHRTPHDVIVPNRVAESAIKLNHARRGRARRGARCDPGPRLNT